MEEKHRDPQDYDHLYKIILIGDTEVGKTHLLSRYNKGTLPKTTQATMGVEFATKIVPLQNGEIVKAQIWDTAGQEKYQQISLAHYKRAVGVLLVYDITNEATFHNANRYIEQIKIKAESDAVIMLVGNKLDLVEKQQTLRKIPTEVAQKFAETNNLLFVETSAVSWTKVNEAFQNLLQDKSLIQKFEVNNKKRK